MVRTFEARFPHGVELSEIAFLPKEVDRTIKNFVPTGAVGNILFEIAEQMERRGDRP